MISEFTENFRFLSNFFPAPVEFEGIQYPSVEHAYQAAKTHDKNLRILFSRLNSAAQAKLDGRHIPIRSDWEQVKDGIMLKLLRSKFEHQSMRARLIATGNESLVEGNYWHDNYWGHCVCSKCQGKTGKNTLGKLLMQVRSEIIEGAQQ